MSEDNKMSEDIKLSTIIQGAVLVVDGFLGLASIFFLSNIDTEKDISDPDIKTALTDAKRSSTGFGVMLLLTIVYGLVLYSRKIKFFTEEDGKTYNLKAKASLGIMILITTILALVMMFSLVKVNANRLPEAIKGNVKNAQGCTAAYFLISLGYLIYSAFQKCKCPAVTA